jgi:RecA-family ATPase
MAAPSRQSVDSTELIPGLLPRHEVSILAGASGAGKTTLIMQALRSALRGESVFGHDAPDGLRIGYIAADRSWQSYKKTAAMVDLDLTKINARALIDDPTIDLKRFEEAPIEELEHLIASLLPCDLIVVDPLVVFLGVDTNKYHLNAARLIRLNKLCQANHVSILGTHHATKARSDYGFKRAQDRISGTSALLGFTSTQLFLAAPDETGRDDGFAEWHIISHHAPKKIILLSRDDNGQFKYEGLESTEPTALGDRLIGWMSEVGEPVTTGDILNHFSDSAHPKKVQRLLRDLKTAGVIKTEERGVYVLAHVAYPH